MRVTIHFDMPSESEAFYDAINGERYRHALMDITHTLENIRESDSLQQEHDLDLDQIDSIQALIHQALVQNDVSWEIDQPY